MNPGLLKTPVLCFNFFFLFFFYPIVLGTVGAPLCGESWAMSYGRAHPSPFQTTAKILQLGGLPWSWVLDWRSLQPGRWPCRGSSYNQQSSTSIAMWQALPDYIVPVAGKVPGLTLCFNLILGKIALHLKQIPDENHRETDSIDAQKLQHYLVARAKTSKIQTEIDKTFALKGVLTVHHLWKVAEN